ncbi:CLUMA_CG007460, isoform A [Clunio marinus]|uniref:CLUMA_CG007460, isoform A n=1 Tax=Clunio marinus TaxID=568069 RepID=A0A1J1I0Y0_9DIPT|nr:CLUMA_CG007460, isoform A [Clunio marinus]
MVKRNQQESNSRYTQSFNFNNETLLNPKEPVRQKHLRKGEEEEKEQHFMGHLMKWFFEELIAY